MKRKILALVLAVLMLVGLVATIVPLIRGASATETVLSLGDVNGDNSVDNLDALNILRYDAALTEFTEAQLKTADVNADDVADNLDALVVLRYDAGLIDRFPAEDSTDASVDETSDIEKEESKIEYPEGAYVVKVFDSADSVTWDTVPKADIDTYKWVDSVEYEAFAQLIYVEDYGFLCRMTCMEENPLAVYTQFGDPVYLDSCMEFFAAWDNASYINIESNSLGTLCAQFGATQRNRKPITDYLSINEIFEMNPVVEKDKWTLTMDIPISKLQKFYGNGMSSETFVSGYTFKGNFYKIGSDAVTGVRHYGMWNEVGGNTPNFHQPNYFGTFVIE